MDLFKYKASVKQIENCKYVKDLEPMIREYNDYLTNSISRRIRQDIILGYKLLTLSLNKFSKLSKKKLSDKIYNSKNGAHEKLLYSILDWSNKSNSWYKPIRFDKLLSYKEFMDVFEFDEVIKLPSSSIFIEQLNQIIDEKPIHFKIVFNHSLTNFDAYSTDLKEDTKRLLYAIRYKQVNFPNRNKTVWEIFLNECLKSYSKLSDNLDNAITKLQQQIKAIKTLSKIQESTF